MKKIYLFSFILALFVSINSFGQSLNNLCQTSFPFCTGITYNNPAGVNSPSAQTGPNYMCLGSEPNPAWYYLQIEQAGEISIDIHTVPQHDVDFICWGPFLSNTSPCISELTGIGSPGSHHVAGAGGGYPAGNTIDCSYDASWQEWCFIPNAQPGEYYIFMITNYSNLPCNIVFNQINAGQTGAGATLCGPVASVSGNFFFDANNNGIKDTTESGLFEGLVYAPSCGYYTQSDSTGNYNGYICAAPDTIWSFYNNNFPYVNVSPGFYQLSTNTTNADFAVSVPPNIFDISTTLTNYHPARPGFDFPCILTLSNMGTELSCGTLTLTYDTIFDYISSTPPADIISGNTLTWNNECLSLFQNKNFNIIFNLDTSVAISTPYMLTANFNLTQNDTNITNNSDSIIGIVVGSYDPNDKQASPEGLIENSAAFAEQEIEYTIRFQNTGTYQATNIRLLDTLSGWLQIPSFTLLSSSHPCTFNISENGIVQFFFDNINLPDINTNETGSHGFVKFKVKCRPELGYGGNVYNTARIYFDFNQPIVTNTALTYTKLYTSIPTVKKPVSSHISVNPNPAKNNITVTVDYNGKENLNLEITDAQGKIVMKQTNPSSKKILNLGISSLSTGTYLIKISSKDFSSVQPLIIY